MIENKNIKNCKWLLNSYRNWVDTLPDGKEKTTRETLIDNIQFLLTNFDKNIIEAKKAFFYLKENRENLKPITMRGSNLFSIFKTLTEQNDDRLLSKIQNLLEDYLTKNARIYDRQEEINELVQDENFSEMLRATKIDFKNTFKKNQSIGDFARNIELSPQKFFKTKQLEKEEIKEKILLFLKAALLKKQFPDKSIDILIDLMSDKEKIYSDDSDSSKILTIDDAAEKNSDENEIIITKEQVDAVLKEQEKTLNVLSAFMSASGGQELNSGPKIKAMNSFYLLDTLNGNNSESAVPELSNALANTAQWSITDKGDILFEYVIKFYSMSNQNIGKNTGPRKSETSRLNSEDSDPYAEKTAKQFVIDKKTHELKLLEINTSNKEKIIGESEPLVETKTIYKLDKKIENNEIVPDIKVTYHHEILYAPHIIANCDNTKVDFLLNIESSQQYNTFTK